MRIVSYYKKAKPNEHFRFWEDGIGLMLPQAINALAGGHDERDLSTRVIYNDCYPTNNGFDIAYCQMFEKPAIRPANFVYTFLSDFIGSEKLVFDWVDKVRPNLLCCLQHLPKELEQFCAVRNCKTIFLPWFVIDQQIDQQIDRPIDGMCSGAIGGHYPWRTKIAESLTKFPNTVVSCGPFGNYPLNNQQYREALLKTKYYFSGGIYDKFIPPKYFEVCNYGCCLVTPELPRMKECGWIDGINYIALKSMNEIYSANLSFGIFQSDRWRRIGAEGKDLIHKKHTVWQRAKIILGEYELWQKQGNTQKKEGGGRLFMRRIAKLEKQIEELQCEIRTGHKLRFIEKASTLSGLILKVLVC